MTHVTTDRDTDSHGGSHRLTLRRRRLLAIVGVTSAGLAGCTGGGGGGSGGTGGGSGSGGGTGGGGGSSGSSGGGGGSSSGGGGDGGSTPMPEPSGPKRWIPGSVLQKAKEEGQVVLYSSMDEPDMKDPLKPTFEAAFDGDITMRPTGLGNVASKLVSEKRTGNVQSDVAMSGRVATRAVGAEGVYVRYENDHWLKQQANEMGYADGFWKAPGARRYEFPGYGLPFTMLYRTESLSEGDVPDDWFQLGDDRWDGEIVMEHPAFLQMSGGLFATLYGEWGEAKWRTFAQNLADNNPQWVDSNSQAYRIVVQGEKSITPNYINDLVAQISAGEDPPVATKWLEPALQESIPTHVTAGGPNPNAAMVLISWLMSEEGQTTIGNTGRTPVHPPTASSHELFKSVIPSGVTVRPTAFNNPTYSGAVYLENPDAWLDLYEQYFGGF